MNEQLSLADLNEMLGFTYKYQQLGAEKIQLDTIYAREILERLIAFESAQ